MRNRNDNDNHHNNNCSDHIQSFYQICFQHREVLYSKYTDAYLKNKELFAPRPKGSCETQNSLQLLFCHSPFRGWGIYMMVDFLNTTFSLLISPEILPLTKSLIRSPIVVVK